MSKSKSTESINYYLKSVKATDSSPIFLQFHFRGQKLRYYLKESVNPKNWNSKKQRVKDASTKTADGQFNINDLLDNLARECKVAYEIESATGSPTASQIRARLQDFINKNHNAEQLEAARPTLFALIRRFTAGEIKTKGRDKAKQTLQNYHAVYLHLKDFAKDSSYRVDFDTINLDFFYKYTTYLTHTKKLAPNTIAKDIRILKVFMNEAVDLEYTENLRWRHKKFTVAGEETDAVYLKESEIVKLHRHDFEGNKRLSQVRDLFVFGCFVGLRFSDYSDVKPENIVKMDGELFIKLITKKTGELVIIPCNPIVLEIFKRYGGSANMLPKSLSNQKFNDYIKEVCKAAELTETGRLSTAPEKELWECISSHSARRSFATNYYLEGFPVIDLMKVTGHKTEKAFMKYIRVSKLDTAKRMAEHNRKKNWAVIVGGVNEKLRIAG